MIVVSGFRRSGTSLMMGLLANNLGEERITGQRKPIPEKSQLETDSMYQIRKEFIQNHLIERKRALNKNGLWECKYTIGGLRYHCENKKIEDNNIVKVVAEGLYKSDPQYIDRIIFMTREPYDEVCSLGNIIHSTSINPDIGQSIPLRNPEQLLSQIVLASKFLSVNKNIPLIFINFYKLIEQPNYWLKVISDFLGEEIIDYSIINKNMIHTQEREGVDLPIWQELFTCYNLFIKKQYDEVIKLVCHPKSEWAKFQLSWPCRNRQVNYNICRSCKEHRNDCIFRRGYNANANI